MEKVLGKITKAQFGFTGYQEAQFGLSLSFSMNGGSTGIGTYILGGWKESIKCTENHKWTENDRSAHRVKMCKEIDKILSDANVDFIDQLVGKPVEITLDGMTFKEFRILTEVL